MDDVFTQDWAIVALANPKNILSFNLLRKSIEHQRSDILVEDSYFRVCNRLPFKSMNFTQEKNKSEKKNVYCIWWSEITYFEINNANCSVN